MYHPISVDISTKIKQPILVKKALQDIIYAQDGNCYLYRRLIMDQIVKNSFNKDIGPNYEKHLKYAIEHDYFNIGSISHKHYLFNLIEGDDLHDCSTCPNSFQCDASSILDIKFEFISKLRFLLIAIILKYEDCFTQKKGILIHTLKEIIKKIAYTNNEQEEIILGLVENKFLEFVTDNEISSKKILYLLQMYGVLELSEKHADKKILEKNQYNLKSNKNTIDTTLSNKAINKLNSMIGLTNAKKQINELNNLLTFRNISKGMVNLPEINLNCFFEGNPGTGKTMVAKMYAEMLYELNLIRDNKIHCVSANSLIAEHVGGTAIKTATVIQEALGGVLFIDEAYQLAPKHEKDFGHECIATIVREITEHKNDIVIIFAGYRDEMERLMNVNPGLKSRITNRIHFEDYNTSELLEILKEKISSSNLILKDTEEEILRNIISLASKNKDFGNARFIENLFQEIIIKHSSNIVQKLNDNIELNDDIIKTISQESLNLLNI